MYSLWARVEEIGIDGRYQLKALIEALRSP
jgi:hypothetical protein